MTHTHTHLLELNGMQFNTKRVHPMCYRGKGGEGRFFIGEFPRLHIWHGRMSYVRGVVNNIEFNPFLGTNELV